MQMYNTFGQPGYPNNGYSGYNMNMQFPNYGYPAQFNNSNVQGQNNYSQQSMTQGGSIVWVSGMSDVLGVNLNPGTAAVFFDKDKDGVYYIKTRDEAGQYSVRVFSSTDITSNPDNTGLDMSKYVTKEELAEFMKRLGGTQNG